MARKRLFWSLYAIYLLTVGLCAVAVGWFAVTTADSLYHDQAVADLETRARLIDQQVGGLVGNVDQAELEAEVHNLGWESGTRITIINAVDGPLGEVGQVLADSELPAASFDNHAGRPEVRAALLGNVGESTHHSVELDQDMLYVAVPSLDADGDIVAVVRTSLPLTRVEEALVTLERRIAAVTGGIALFVAAVGLWVTRRISGRLEEIRRGAARFAAGDFGRTLRVSRVDEIGSVAESLNEMAAQLDRTIRGITQQSNEREAILTGMVEGVLAVDTDERIITINAAAGKLLGVDPADSEHRTIHETVRNTDLQRFVTEALAAAEPIERELGLYVDGDDRILQVHGSPLRDRRGETFGAVVVLNDVTRQKRLEAVRRDFVANVSHEIKTPVTSIKGFAETLRDDAPTDPEEASRFLRIIAGQADRLGAIIEDLLSLSALEGDAVESAVELERGSVCDVLQVAVKVCELKAEAKGIDITLACSPELFADISPPLLEQAVVNLIDNAIKYSPDGSTVAVEVDETPDETVISVTDHGCGIAREHLPRLFERFYRVDKARSRTLGGTGLGLSIVKHIAQVHGGRVSVASAVNLGSTFRIHLPV